MIIDPCVPAEWKNFKITRLFRGKRLKIHVKNKLGVQKGVKQLTINGERLESNFIPIEKMESDNMIYVDMG